MSYSSAVDYLFSLQLHTIKLGLDAMNDFLSKVGNPHNRLKFVHIAGTNGKGSVCQGLMSIFRQAGYKVGVYTSPHLFDVRERFRINDRYISESEFARQVERIQKILGDDRITYFECTTAIALLWFADEQPDIVLLETGMGGRLDATNVVEPLVSIITNVSMDHEAYLGNTISRIAGEKAGIIKPHVPVVSGCTADAVSVIEKQCRICEAPLYQLGKELKVSRNSDDSWNIEADLADIPLRLNNMRCSLEGEHQLDNMALVIAAAYLLTNHGFSIDELQLRSGLLDLYWPGRLEHLVITRTECDRVKEYHYLLDGAHNPAGIASLIATLQSRYKDKTVTLIYAAMGDKDRLHTLPKLASCAERIIITRPESERAALPLELYNGLDDSLKMKCRICDNVDQAIEEAEHNSCNGDSLIVVAGSLYLVGAVRYKLVGNLVEN